MGDLHQWLYDYKWLVLLVALPLIAYAVYLIVRASHAMGGERGSRSDPPPPDQRTTRQVADGNDEEDGDDGEQGDLMDVLEGGSSSRESTEALPATEPLGKKSTYGIDAKARTHMNLDRSPSDDERGAGKDTSTSIEKKQVEPGASPMPDPDARTRRVAQEEAADPSEEATAIASDGEKEKLLQALGLSDRGDGRNTDPGARVATDELDQILGRLDNALSQTFDDIQAGKAAKKEARGGTDPQTTTHPAPEPPPPPPADTDDEPEPAGKKPERTTRKLVEAQPAPSEADDEDPADDDGRTDPEPESAPKKSVDKHDIPSWARADTFDEDSEEKGGEQTNLFKDR